MWSKFDDQFYLNPKNDKMDRDEQDLYMAGIIYCNGQLTDGFIPNSKIQMLAVWAKLNNEASASAIASRLVEHMYWEVVECGYQVHDFLDWNLSKEQVLVLKQERSEAGRRGGLQSGAKRQAIASASAQAKSKQNRTQSQSQSLNKESYTQQPQFSESLVADKLVMKITGWMAIPRSEENLEFMRDIPTIIANKGDGAENYLRGFWNTYSGRYSGSTRLGWIAWALTGVIPAKKDPPKNNNNKPTKADDLAKASADTWGPK